MPYQDEKQRRKQILDELAKKRIGKNLKIIFPCLVNNFKSYLTFWIKS